MILIPLYFLTMVFQQVWSRQTSRRNYNAFTVYPPISKAMHLSRKIIVFPICDLALSLELSIELQSSGYYQYTKKHSEIPLPFCSSMTSVASTFGPNYMYHFLFMETPLSEKCHIRIESTKIRQRPVNQISSLGLCKEWTRQQSGTCGSQVLVKVTYGYTTFFKNYLFII